MAGSVKIKLSSPMDVDGVKVSELSMREPTVADQLVAEKMSGSAAEKEVAMVANLCEVTPEDIGKLTLRDYRKVQEAFAGFTG